MKARFGSNSNTTKETDFFQARFPLIGRKAPLSQFLKLRSTFSLINLRFGTGNAQDGFIHPVGHNHIEIKQFLIVLICGIPKPRTRTLRTSPSLCSQSAFSVFVK